ncbi:MAG TPA: hypothetical protein VGQ83_30840 [Polyangia bacterium]
MLRAAWKSRLALLGACSSAPAIPAACAAYARTVCALRDGCTAGLGVLVRYGDSATCEAREAVACGRELAAPGTGVTAAVLEACTAALPAQSCGTFFEDRPIAACAAAGARAIGAGCAVNGQCAAGYCQLAGGSACGACAAAPAAGAPCPNTGEVAAGLACSKVTRTWVPLGGAGAACDAGDPCGAGLACVGADPPHQVPGACLAAITTLDAACDPQRATGADCDRNLGLYCTAAGTCADIILAEPWGDCGRLLDDSVAMCTYGSVCIFPVGSRQGTCVQPVPDGTTCDSASGPPCLAPARCVSPDGGTTGTCQLLDPAACG